MGWMCGLKRAERHFITRLPAPQRHEVYVFAKELGSDCEDQITALLTCKPGDDPEQRALEGLFRKVEFLQECALAGPFARKIVRRVTADNFGIGSRIPTVVVSTVEDAG